MATIDLTTLNWSNGGANHVLTSVGTTNKEIKLPKWAKLVTVQAVSQGIKVSYEGTDGASPVAGAFPQAVNSIIQYNPVQTSSDRFMYLAGQASTATIFLIFE
jgi:hypothetical protein